MRSRLFTDRLLGLALVACLPLTARADNPGVAWRTNLDAAKVEAAQSGRLVLLHFTTKTCGPCRTLDKTVFSQPQVGQAIEQDYVPVRIDADAQPAIARMYRVDRVPTEIIIAPNGQPLFNPQIPNTPEPYIGQLQNMARHFRQSNPAGAPTEQQPVNSAYAGLPAPTPAAVPNPFVTSPSSIGGQQPAVSPVPAALQQAAQSPVQQSVPPQLQQPSPEAMTNPYMAAAPDADRYGQAQNVYGGVAPAPAQTAMNQSAMAPPLNQQAPAPQQSQQAYSPVQPQAQQGAITPTGPMPNGYGSSPANQAALAAGAAATSGAPSANSGIAATPPNAAAGYPSTDAMLAASAAAAAVQPPAQPKIELPAGSPALGFEGYCPVTLKTLKKWTLGDAQYGVVHRGRTYLFAGAEQRDQFLADPDAYSPVFAGMDPVLLIDRQESIEGSRKFGYEYGGAFYLFVSKETMQKFAASPHTYAAGVRQAMNRIDATGGTLRR